jgi:hypothetical protein
MCELKANEFNVRNGYGDSSFEFPAETLARIGAEHLRRLIAAQTARALALRVDGMHNRDGSLAAGGNA